MHTMNDPILLTKAAADKIKMFAFNNSLDSSWYLYVGVKGGGCSGLEWVMDIRDRNQHPLAETDETCTSQGILIASDLKSFVVGNLGGTKIDYQDGLVKSGFVFENEKFSHRCGCQRSFSP